MCTSREVCPPTACSRARRGSGENQAPPERWFNYALTPAAPKLQKSHGNREEGPLCQIQSSPVDSGWLNSDTLMGLRKGPRSQPSRQDLE